MFQGFFAGQVVEVSAIKVVYEEKIGHSLESSGGQIYCVLRTHGWHKMLRASTEVPTLRKVEVDFLVRGKTSNEIAGKLADMATWLYNAGTAKLFSDQDPNHYYKARCTSVSTPEFSGLFARFTATFTCADYKLYNAQTNQPLTSTATDLSNFTFAGKHCLNDMECVFVEESRDVTPEVKANKYEIAGMNGTLRYLGGSAALAEKQLSGTLYLVNLQDENGLLDETVIAQRLHEIASWLVNAQRAELVLDSDITRQYEAEVIAAASVTRNNWDNGAIKIRFVLQPVSMDVTAKVLEAASIQLQANTAATVSLEQLFTEGIGYATPMTLTITNNGTGSITDLTVYCYDEQNNERAMSMVRRKFYETAYRPASLHQVFSFQTYLRL